jgi:hypothetical protein
MKRRDFTSGKERKLFDPKHVVIGSYIDGITGTQMPPEQRQVPVENILGDWS